MSSQSKRMSWAEVISSTFVGFSVATVANFYVLPLFGYAVTFSHSFWIGIVMTFISIIRSYIFRRIFNHLHTRGYV